jgi:hypothetical protein
MNAKASADEQHHGKEYSNFKAKSSVSHHGKQPAQSNQAITNQSHGQYPGIPIKSEEKVSFEHPTSHKHQTGNVSKQQAIVKSSVPSQDKQHGNFHNAKTKVSTTVVNGSHEFASTVVDGLAPHSQPLQSTSKSNASLMKKHDTKSTANKPCKFFHQQGFCKHGNTCQYSHGSG